MGLALWLVIRGVGDQNVISKSAIRVKARRAGAYCEEGSQLVCVRIKVNM